MTMHTSEDKKTTGDSASLPPGNTGIHEALAAQRQGGYEWSRERAGHYGRVCRTTILGKDAVLLSGEAGMRAFYDSDLIARERAMPDAQLALLGDGTTRVIASMDGHEHVARKAILLRSMTKEALDRYRLVIEDVLQHFIEGRWRRRQYFGWNDEMQRMCFEALSLVIVGRLGNDEMFECYKRLALAFRGREYAEGIVARDKLLGWYREVLHSRKNSTSPPHAVIDHLRQSGELTDDEIVAEIQHLFFGASGIYCLCCNLVSQLAAHPVILERVRQEVQGLPAQPSVAELDACNYLECVVKEVSRTSPIINVQIGRVLKAFVLDGHVVPAGWLALAGLHATNHDSGLHPRPDDFNPDRFATPESAPRGSRCPFSSTSEFAYVPFGGGDARQTHRCVGEPLVKLIMKTLLVRLARDYVWAPVDPKEPLVLDSQTPHRESGFWVTFLHRDDVPRAFAGMGKPRHSARPLTQATTPDKHLRIAIIGAGATGLTAAHHLRKQGYENVTVFEKNASVGGMCESVEIEGRIYDLGGHLCLPAYSTMRSLVAEMGLEAEPVDWYSLYDIDKRQIIPKSTALVSNREVYQRYERFQREYAESTEPGIAARADDYAAPTFKWLESKGLTDLRDYMGLGAFYTAAGYGYLSLDIPAAYFLTFTETLNSKGEYWTPRGGALELWKRIASHLDVRCNTHIEAVKRFEDGRVLIRTADGEFEFDRLILACPLKQALSFLDASDDERELFGKIKTFRYYTTVLSVEGNLPKADLTLLKKHTDDASTIGHATAMGHYHKDTNVYAFFSYGNELIGPDEITANLYEDIRQMGGRVVQYHLQREWGSYFPHVSSHDMALGFYRRLEGLQGMRSTYYAGSLLSFELMECCAAYAKRLVERFFSEAQPHSAPLSKANSSIKTLPEQASIITRLLHQVNVRPDRRAYVGLDDHANIEEVLTFRDLLQRAFAVSQLLLDKANVKPGDRVALVYPPGLDYAVAIWGCLLAGAVAVPCAPPDPRHLDKDIEKFAHIVKDCGCNVALTSLAYRMATGFEGIKSFFRGRRSAWPNLEWFSTDRLGSKPYDAEYLRRHGVRITPSTLAALQYTSGSTQAPRGVMLTHGNIVHNCTVMAVDSGVNENSVYVMWVPLFHDMGLTGGAFNAVNAGATLVFLSPLAFLKDPQIWLQAIERHGATHTSAPNFGYDYCYRRVNEAHAHTARLGTLVSAMNGGEAPRAETISGFCDKFYDAGFRLSAFRSAYGMAEHTLYISAWNGRPSPTLLRFDAHEMEQSGRIVPTKDGITKRTHTLVGSGIPNQALGMHVLIVDPNTQEVCPPDVVGEIWLSSPSASTGYFGKTAEENALIFKCSPAGDEGTGRTYLRTGDLGFLHQRELFVCGRLKEMIIAAGRNLYPQDIEAALADCHPGLRPGCAAAFSLDDGTKEHLVVVAEIRQSDAKPEECQAITRAMLAAITTSNQVTCDVIALMPPRTISKTTSGKIQRKKCREQYIAGTLPLLHVSRFSTAAESKEKAERRMPEKKEIASPIAAKTLHLPSNHDAQRPVIVEWMKNQLAEQLQTSPDEIDPSVSIDAYGITSLNALELAGKLSAFMGRDLPPTVFFDHPSIEGLADYLGKPAPSGRDVRNTVLSDTDAIAIVGMSCRLPGGANDIASFWQLLRDGVDAVGEIPKDRFNADFFYDSTPRPQKMYTRNAACLEHVDGFDADFFGIDEVQAKSLDPQHRMLLEVTYEALENANIPIKELAGSSTGVFLGLCTQDYQTMAHDSGAYYTYNRHIIHGNSAAMAASRVAFVFDFRGPSFSIDSACSSSLQAVHLGCNSLKHGETNMVIVGGAHLIIEPATIIANCQAGVITHSGRSRVFDASADGYVPGEGIGVVVLKRLSDALQNGDRIMGIIRGSAVTHAGRGINVEMPTVDSQEQMLRKALAAAKVEPHQIDFIEAHGHASPILDTIELSALERVYGTREIASARRAPLTLGSVKSNIGYPYAACGVIALIKLCLSLEHKEIPPTLHFQKLNPNVRPFEESGWARIATELEPWNRRENTGPRLGGVSALGMGGSNVHLIVEEAPSTVVAHCADKPLLLCISAKTPEALRELAGRYARRLEGLSSSDALRVCYTAAVGRSPMAHRLAIVATSGNELHSALAAYIMGAELATNVVVSGQLMESVEAMEDDHAVLHEMARRYVEGAPMNWEMLYAGTNVQKIDVPTYPFQRKRYWYDFEHFEVPRYWEHALKAAE